MPALIVIILLPVPRSSSAGSAVKFFVKNVRLIVLLAFRQKNCVRIVIKIAFGFPNLAEFPDRIIATI